MTASESTAASAIAGNLSHWLEDLQAHAEAHVLEDGGDEKAIGREEIKVAVVAVQRTELAGIGALRLDEAAEQARGSDDLTRTVRLRGFVSGMEPWFAWGKNPPPTDTTDSSCRRPWR